MAVVAPLDLVAFKNIAMMGYWVGVRKTEVMSPIPNKIAIENAIAKAPLINCAINMLLGTTVAEFFTSSPVDSISQKIYERNNCRYSLIWLVPSIPGRTCNVIMLSKMFRAYRLTYKRPSRREESEKPTNTVAFPPTDVFKTGKDEPSRALRRQVDQRDQKYEEEANMEDKCGGFDMRKDPNTQNVDQNGNEEYGPVDHRCVPT